ncbi:MAG TPA: tripartite tricarboxylate transporter substrate binding protein, partial [Chloroflexota bacterium]|nr:tripartite tricarboxylate transporter substrate binding protein [Chloroflexota bacterium]
MRREDTEIVTGLSRRKLLAAGAGAAGLAAGTGLISRTGQAGADGPFTEGNFVVGSRAVKGHIAMLR